MGVVELAASSSALTFQLTSVQENSLQRIKSPKPSCAPKGDITHFWSINRKRQTSISATIIAAKQGTQGTDVGDCSHVSIGGSDVIYNFVNKRGRNRSFCSCGQKDSQIVEAARDDLPEEGQGSLVKETETVSLGVRTALVLLRFYKAEISPLLPGSCRYVPTCSEYGMEAFKRYGVLKGSILTAWRLARCNPLGGSGFDPPRWFGEPRPPSY